jgi:hypothetical protein
MLAIKLVLSIHRINGILGEPVPLFKCKSRQIKRNYQINRDKNEVFSQKYALCGKYSVSLQPK